MRAGDSDRERAAAALQEHYVGGRLTLEEFSERTGRVLAARSRAEIRRALSDLPVFPDPAELAAHGRSLLQNGASGTALVGFLLVWLVPTYLLSRLWHRPTPHRRTVRAR